MYIHSGICIFCNIWVTLKARCSDRNKEETSFVSIGGINGTACACCSGDFPPSALVLHSRRGLPSKSQLLNCQKSHLQLAQAQAPRHHSPFNAINGDPRHCRLLWLSIYRHPYNARHILKWASDWIDSYLSLNIKHILLQNHTQVRLFSRNMQYKKEFPPL